MDRSLIFFYSMAGLGIIWALIALFRDKKRWQTLACFASLLAGMYISSEFFALSGGTWFISSLVLAYIIPTVMIFIVYILRARATKKQLMRTVEGIRREGIVYLAEQLRQDGTPEWKNKEWYALNSPAQNTFEIGMNPCHLTPVIGEKFRIAVLSGRMFRFKPEFIIPMADINTEMVCRLADFYAFSDESQQRVTDYLEAIKNNSAEPWKIIASEPDKPA